MNQYNAPFFGLYQNLYLVSRDQLGPQKAMLLFTATMEKGLTSAYGNNFIKGNTGSFVKAVGDRDKAVGLDVRFKDVTKDSLKYEFHTDPFPGLKGQLPHRALDHSYMNFKVRHLLGNNWEYETTKHLWNGDPYTQHWIKKNRP
jgi:hypothetical protein